MNKLNSDENLHKAFTTFDTDESGYITHDELLDALKSYGMDITGVDQILQDVDTVRTAHSPPPPVPSHAAARAEFQGCWEAFFVAPAGALPVPVSDWLYWPKLCAC
jgi:hypothetical protein